MILDQLPLHDHLWMDASTHALTSEVHGPAHWERVAENCIRLAADTPGANLTVALHFALIHDAFRWNDNRDSDHGYRACDWALAHAQAFPVGFPLGELADALAKHADGLTAPGKPTSGVCWDADRLDLGRVGTRPDPAFMSTKAGQLAASSR